MKIKSIISVTAALALSACAIQQQPKIDFKWVERASSKQKVEFAIADPSCAAESYKAAPVVPITYCGDKSSYNRGYCIGYQNQMRTKMAAVRAKVYEGCMLEKGWVKQPIQ